MPGEEHTILNMPQALESQDSPINIRNVHSDFSQFYRMDAPFQLTMEYCNGSEAEDYVNIVTLSPDKSILYQETLAEKNRVRTKATPHIHDFYEFVIVLEGNIDLIIEEKEYLYTAGSCCLLNRSLRHLERYHSGCRVLFLGISPEFMEELFASAQNSSFPCEKEFYGSDIHGFITADLRNPGKKEYIDFIPAYQNRWKNNRGNCPEADNLRSLAESMMKIMLSPSFGASFQISGLLCDFLSRISSPCHYHSTVIRLETGSDFLIFSRVSRLFEESDGRISRSGMEQLLHYSGDYLNRIVNKYTGMSLFEYGMTFCLKKAARYLTETNEPISEIAARLHFSNRTHFYSLFKEKYGVTPKEYRKMHQ
ncbi:MAG: AraC family transcriptional regulator [Lachnospiraceae bacterium]|nr:AraC family transcriptional regulator [Lachnospiraceae bacterium]